MIYERLRLKLLGHTFHRLMTLYVEKLLSVNQQSHENEKKPQRRRSDINKKGFTVMLRIPEAWSDTRQKIAKRERQRSCS